MPEVDYKVEFQQLRQQSDLKENNLHDSSKSFVGAIYAQSNIPVFNIDFTETIKEVSGESSKSDLGPSKSEVLGSLKETVDDKKVSINDKEEVVYKEKTPVYEFKLNNSVKLVHHKTVLDFFEGTPQSKTTQVVVIAPTPQVSEDNLISDEALELMHKMLKAMKLKETDFYYHFYQDDVNVDDFYSVLIKLNPKLVITFGASTTNFLLEKKERLSNIHGQTFLKVLKTGDKLYRYHFVPIFHPDYLLINPQLKKTAWLDLQKCMKILGLSL